MWESSRTTYSHWPNYRPSFLSPTCRNVTSGCAVPGLILLLGMVLGVACFPIALAALALIIVEVFGTSYATGFLIAVVREHL